MPDERQTLLAAILDRPTDDLPRLFYADYLSEHGDPVRAEFIRAQIELSRCLADDNLFADSFVHATKSIIDIPTSEYRNWLAELGLILPTESRGGLDFVGDRVRIKDEFRDVQYGFHRGFLDRITAPSRWILPFCPRLSGTPLTRITFQPQTSTASVSVEFDLQEVWITRLVARLNRREFSVERRWENRDTVFAGLAGWLPAAWQELTPGFEEAALRGPYTEWWLAQLFPITE